MNIEYFILILSLVFCGLSLLLNVWGSMRKNRLLLKSAYRAYLSYFVLFSLALLFLWYRIFSHDYSYLFVYSHIDSVLSPLFMISSLWGGKEGSMMLFTWAVACSTVVVMYKYRAHLNQFMSFFLILSCLVSLFFSMGLVTGLNPFKRIYPVPTEGLGLNPILQHVAMVIHPPLVFAAYGLIIVCFVYWSALLWKGRYTPSSSYRVLHQLVFCSWALLTAGIVLGMWWSYYCLGWGGYWNWDPVENFALMVWLLLSALLNMVLIMRKKKVWFFQTSILVFLVFFSVMLSVFISRSGILTSQHSYSYSPVIMVFVPFMAIVFLFYFALLIWRARIMTGLTLDDFYSTESLLIQDNIVSFVVALGLLTAAFAPLLVSSITGGPFSLGPFFYSIVTFPLLIISMVIKFFLIRVPGDNAPDYSRDWWIGLLALCSACSMVFWTRNPLVIFSVFVMTAVILRILQVWWFSLLKVMKAGYNLPRACRVLFFKIPDIFSMQLLYLGMMIFFAGIILSSALIDDKVVALEKDSKFGFHGYQFSLSSIRQSGSNPMKVEAVVNAQKAGKKLEFVSSKKFYPGIGSRQTDVAVHTTGISDYYLILQGWENMDVVTVSLIHRPLVSCIWLGGLFMVLGSLLTVVNQKRLIKGD